MPVSRLGAFEGLLFQGPSPHLHWPHPKAEKQRSPLGIMNSVSSCAVGATDAKVRLAFAGKRKWLISTEGVFTVKTRLAFARIIPVSKEGAGATVKVRLAFAGVMPMSTEGAEVVKVRLSLAGVTSILAEAFSSIATKNHFLATDSFMVLIV